MSELINSYRKITNGVSLSYHDVTPNDSVEVRKDTVLVGINGDGTMGDISIEQNDGSTFIFKSVAVGGSFCCNPLKVNATGTTATGLYVGVSS